MLTLFGRTFQPGEKAFFTVDGPDFANLAVVKIPVIVLHGREKGPVLWINGAVHGDEINGSAAAWTLARELDPALLKGSLVITPIANVAAFMDNHTISRVDEMNMDTQFPGSADGAFAQRLAKLIYDQVRGSAHLMLSFHTMNKTHEAETYTVSKVVPGVPASVTQRARDMAFAFGAKANCVVDLASAAGELPGVTVGALDIVCMQDGIPAFMAEMGHGSIVDPQYVAEGIAGIRNVMILNGMLEGTIQRPKLQYKITKRHFLRAQRGGMFHSLARSGGVVRAGEAFGEYHYFGEETTPHTLPEDSYVIGTRVWPAVSSGDRIGFVGTQWEAVG